jgi:hypothetical protein
VRDERGVAVGRETLAIRRRALPPRSCGPLRMARVNVLLLTPASRAATHLNRSLTETTNTKDLTLARNKPYCKHRNIASARTQIQHPHPIFETRCALKRSATNLILTGSRAGPIPLQHRPQHWPSRLGLSIG